MTVKPLIAGIFLTTASLLPAAHAEFYKLDGRYQCIGKANTVCGDAARSYRPAPEITAPVVATLEDIRPGAPPVTIPLTATPRPARNPFYDLAQRMRAGRPLPGDIETLRVAVKANDASAAELLAWCDLTGTGTARNPIEAYILYGVAALNGVPRASHNQSIIYDTVLNPEQRQQLLNIRNSDPAMVRIFDGR
jgi:hypothetical protein